MCKFKNLWTLNEIFENILLNFLSKRSDISESGGFGPAEYQPMNNVGWRWFTNIRFWTTYAQQFLDPDIDEMIPMVNLKIRL